MFIDSHASENKICQHSFNVIGDLSYTIYRRCCKIDEGSSSVD